MVFKNSHLSDEDLLRAADGEWPARRQSEIRRHLEACWACRSRMAEMEKSITNFIDCYHSTLERQLPTDDGAAAMLRQRLAAESSLAGGFGKKFKAPLRHRRGSVREWVLAAVPLLLALLLVGSVLVKERIAAETVPNPNLTPGEATAASTSDLCGARRQTENRKVPEALREAVFSAYGMKNAPREAYEVDFLITPELGGSASLRNLWPEPYGRGAWNARVKDALEERLHALVCRGDVDLSTAQREIATNWVSAYKKYVGTGHPM
jgi:hypothetical protein